MTIGRAILQGFAIARRTRSAVWVLLLVNLGLAAWAASPIYSGLLGFTGHSLMSQILASGFSTDWLTDFSFNNKGIFDHYAGIILWFGLVSLPVNAILAEACLLASALRSRSILWATSSVMPAVTRRECCGSW